MAILIFAALRNSTSNKSNQPTSHFTEFADMSAGCLQFCWPLSCFFSLCQLFVYRVSAVCLQSVSKTVWDASVASPWVIWGTLLTGSHISHSRLVPKIANLRVRAKFGLPLQKKNKEDSWLKMFRENNQTNFVVGLAERWKLHI